MSTVASKRPPGATASPGGSPSRSGPRASTPTGHVRSRPSRSGAGLASSRPAAPARREAAESDARAETALAVEDLQQRLAREETRSEQYMKQTDVLQAKLDDAIQASTRLEDRVHEFEEQIDVLNNEKRDATRKIREMESIYESERSAIHKEKEELANREEEMQAVIQRLKDSLAQRNADDDGGRLSRQPGPSSSSPSLDGSFAPSSSMQRSDSRNSSKLILQKDKLIESLRLELAEAQIKLVETDNQDGSRLQELERLLVEARMANARLLEDNESYQLLLQDKTLKGDFGYMSSNVNQDALDALEGKSSSCLADELSTATASEAEPDRDRRLEAELKSVKEQNKALTMYINKIIGRLLEFQEFESVLSQSGELRPPIDVNKDLPSPPDGKQPTLMQRARSLAAGVPAVKAAKPRPMSYMPTSGTGHTDPDTAPRIPIGNLGRTTSTRRARPQSEQFLGTTNRSPFRGSPDRKLSSSSPPPPPVHGRHSHTLFSPPGLSGNPNAAARNPSGGSSSSQPAASGNFPGMRSETSSLSGTESGGVSTPPSQSPPRSHSDKQTTFAGGKPRPLLLVQEKADATPAAANKRSSWLQGWAGWAGVKKDDGQASAIPE
ncbi:putative M protein, serotype 2.1 precursor [Ophiocordyceps camponoti-floridani]|uniref:Putative M protein, serotype 2.1 n=1 Tax=Ophiocordyceps camponoti-floridani TaxID=2030778 RepID=A0A8H4Q9K6_9HYPO|nr:putative M protein, serotype 2.1 precursor [Ophiocordyceps camponoti-floridani]